MNYPAQACLQRIVHNLALIHISITRGGDLLPSGYFILTQAKTDGKVTGYAVTGGGLGHGAGMSQNGARLLAEQEKDYLTILDYFYRNVTLATME